jgi:uncharacterized protein YjiS (DUF1127 family)
LLRRLGAIGAAIADLLYGFRDWQARRSSAGLLRGLNDHTLRDIGIHRSELDAVTQIGVREWARELAAKSVPRLI